MAPLLALIRCEASPGSSESSHTSPCVTRKDDHPKAGSGRSADVWLAAASLAAAPAAITLFTVLLADAAPLWFLMWPYAIGLPGLVFGVRQVMLGVYVSDEGVMSRSLTSTRRVAWPSVSSFAVPRPRSAASSWVETRCCSTWPAVRRCRRPCCAVAGMVNSRRCRGSVASGIGPTNTTKSWRCSNASSRPVAPPASRARSTRPCRPRRRHRNRCAPPDPVASGAGRIRQSGSPADPQAPQRRPDRRGVRRGDGTPAPLAETPPSSRHRQPGPNECRAGRSSRQT